MATVTDSPSVVDPRFNDKRNEWIRYLSPNDGNNVLTQVHQMIYGTAVIRMVLEAIRIAPREEPSGTPRLNWLVLRSTIDWYFDSQFVAIRRVLDTGKGVFSLRRLVNDLRENNRLLTRKNLCHAAGVSFVHDPTKSEDEPHNDPWRIREWHAAIDRLCSVSPTNRSPDDAVPKSLFDRLSKRLDDAGKRIVAHVDEFVAHACKPECRKLTDRDKITLADLDAAHEVICRTCDFIDSFLLRNTSHAFLAIVCYDKFAHVDAPLVTTNQVASLDQHWRAYEDRTRDWGVDNLAWAIGPRE